MQLRVLVTLLSIATATLGQSQLIGHTRYGSTPFQLPTIPQDSAHFGRAIANIGDLNGDGGIELAISGRTFNGYTWSDVVHIAFMATNGAVDSLVTISADDTIAGGLFVAGARAGFSLAGVGDINDDGTPDLAIGAPGVINGTDRGAIHLLMLRNDGRVIATMTFNGGDLPTNQAGQGSAFGSSICMIGDVDLNGRDDIFVGAPYEDIGGTDRGAGYILLLSDTLGIRTTTRLAWQQGGMGTALAQNGLHFGAAVCRAGDMNEDGIPDLFVTTPGDTLGGGLWSILLGSSGTAVDKKAVLDDTDDQLKGVQRGAAFGTSIALLNHRGATRELVVGCGADVADDQRFWMVNVEKNAKASAERCISDLGGECTNKFPFQDADGIGGVLATGPDLDGNGSFDLLVGAPNTSLGGEENGTFWTMLAAPMSAEPYVFIRTSTLTAPATATGVFEAMPVGYGSAPPSITWRGSPMDNVLKSVTKGPVSVTITDGAPVARLLHMGYEVHWKSDPQALLQKRDLLNDVPLGHTKVARATNQFEAADSVWLEYTAPEKNVSCYFGFSNEKDVSTSAKYITAGFLFTADGEAFRLNGSSKRYLGRAEPGFVYHIRRYNNATKWLVNGIGVDSLPPVISPPAYIKIDAGVHGARQRLAGLRCSHVPAMTLTLQVQHPTAEEPSSGMINVIDRWGKGPYYYAWSTGSTDRRIFDLEEGHYEVVVKDHYDEPDTLRIDLATAVTLMPTEGVRYENGDLYRIDEGNWENATAMAENSIAANDSGWVQITVLDSISSLGIALRDTSSGDAYTAVLGGKYGELLFNREGEGDTDLLFGEPLVPIAMAANDVIAIRREIVDGAARISFLHNGKEALIYREKSNRDLVLEVSLGEAKSRVRHLVGRFTNTNATVRPCDDPWNHRTIWRYHEDGQLAEHSRVFLDHLGRPVQTQTSDLATKNVLVAHTLYDRFGRPALNTLPAPTFSSRLECFHATFLTAPNGAPYSIEHFDKPVEAGAVGEQLRPSAVRNIPRGSLGWYYSTNNDREPMVAASGYPFTRTLYHHDALGRAMAIYGPGDAYKPGSGHGTEQFTFTGADMLERLLPKDKWGGLVVTKSVMVDPHGVESITYTNENGQVLATCRSGMASECPVQEVRTCLPGFGDLDVDIHLPASQKQVHGLVSSLRLPIYVTETDQITYRIMDIRTGRKLVQGTDYVFQTLTLNSVPLDRFVKFLGSYSTGNSYLRIGFDITLGPCGQGCDNHIQQLREQQIWYALDYGHWTLNEYNTRGELTATVPPEGVDCNVQYTYEVNNIVWDADNDNAGLDICLGDELGRLPRTVDDVMGTALMTTDAEAYHSIVPISPGQGHQRTVRFFVGMNGHEPVQREEPLDDYMEFYDQDGRLRSEQVQTCDYIYHDPNAPRYQDYTAEVQDHLRRRQQNPSGTFPAVKLPYKLGQTTGTPKMLRPTDIISPDDPWPREPSPDPCQGKPLEGYAAFWIKLRYYGVSSTGEKTELMSLASAPAYNSTSYTEHYISLSRNCECDMFWSSVDEQEKGFVLDASTDYDHIAVELEGVDVQVPGHPRVPYSQYNYRHDLARFIALYIDVRVETMPGPITGQLHRMRQTFEYNGLSQLVKGTDPDRGESIMLYDQKGHLRFSRNAEQAVSTPQKRFSFVDHDQAGRTIRTGVLAYTPGGTDTQFPGWSVTGPTADQTGYLEGTTPLVGALEEVAEILYDEAAPDFPTSQYPTLAQRIPPGAVSRTSNAESIVWYSYDVRGRLAWTIHRTVGLDKYHTVHYSYNMHGQVEHMVYQPEVPTERFDQWFTYDRMGRPRRVLTGTDGLDENATEQASHTYYLHGPLKRKTLGENLQGLDYVYTLQGWLKAINSPDENRRDPGGDGLAGALNANVKEDLFGMALDYHANDYSSRASLLYNGAQVTDELAPQRFNGLIRAQRWNNRGLGSTSTYRYGGQNLLYAYQYDAYGQLTQAKLATVNVPLPAIGEQLTIAPLPGITVKSDYEVSGITYDKNGNIVDLERHGRSDVANVMDDLHYVYPTDGNGDLTCNRLLQVTDAVADQTAYTTYGLPTGQGANNYTYNALGQLTGNAKEGRYFAYYANGRVRTVFANSAKTQKIAHFTYDAAGNRLLKEIYASNGTDVTQRTWYLRDARGALLSYQQHEVGVSTPVEELSISGVGSYMRSSGKVRYQISDHLGNTRVSFTKNTNGTLQVVEAHDYYPHGGLLPGRQLNGSNGSPLAYQGQEYDEEVGLTAFNLRQYDARLGRWLTTDPYGQHYSPYLGMNNNPVSFMDPDGGLDMPMNDPERHFNNQQEYDDWMKNVKRDERFEAAWARGMAKSQLSKHSGAHSSSTTLADAIEADEEFAQSMRQSTGARVPHKIMMDMETGTIKVLSWKTVGGYAGDDGAWWNSYAPLTKGILTTYIENNMCIGCSEGMLQNETGSKFESAWHEFAEQTPAIALRGYMPNVEMFRGSYKGLDRNVVPDGTATSTGSSFNTQKPPILYEMGSWFEVKAMTGGLYTSSNTGQLSGHITALKRLHPYARSGDLFLHIVTTADVVISPGVQKLADQSGVTVVPWYATFRIDDSGLMQVRFNRVRPFPQRFISYSDEYETDIPIR